MPYVEDRLRIRINAAVNEIIDCIKQMDDTDRDGTVVFCLCRITAGSLKPAAGWSWRSLKNARACFFESASEFYRRLTAAREDDAIRRNGDIPEFSEPWANHPTRGAA